MGLETDIQPRRQGEPEVIRNILKDAYLKGFMDGVTLTTLAVLVLFALWTLRNK